MRRWISTRLCGGVALVAIGAAGLEGAEPPMPALAAGALERWHLESREGLPSRWVDVWLPPGYDSASRCPVLYLQDGQALFDAQTTWNGQEWGVDETLDALIAGGDIPPVVVVGIWNAGPAHRHAEYFPQKPFEALSEAQRTALLAEAREGEGAGLFSGEVRSDRYLRFVVGEVLPWVEARYRVRTDPAGRFIGGSSMGGLISIYAVCEYPGIFGGAACLSTHWPGIFRNEDNPIPDAFIAYLEEHLPPANRHRLYFDRGDATLDALYPPHQDRVDGMFRARGFDAAHWQSRVFPGADHSEKAWRERLAIPLRFLFASSP